VVSFTHLAIYPRWQLGRRLRGPPEPGLTLWRREKYFEYAGNRTATPQRPARSLAAIPSELRETEQNVV
jgi:hypothetical protein